MDLRDGDGERNRWIMSGVNTTRTTRTGFKIFFNGTHFFNGMRTVRLFLLHVFHATVLRSILHSMQVIPSSEFEVKLGTYFDKFSSFPFIEVSHCRSPKLSFIPAPKFWSLESALDPKGHPDPNTLPLGGHSHFGRSHLRSCLSLKSLGLRKLGTKQKAKEKTLSL